MFYEIGPSDVVGKPDWLSSHFSLPICISLFPELKPNDLDFFKQNFFGLNSPISFCKLDHFKDILTIFFLQKGQAYKKRISLFPELKRNDLDFFFKNFLGLN